jgi:hypothetical protein
MELGFLVLPDGILHFEPENILNFGAIGHDMPPYSIG